MTFFKGTAIVTTGILFANIIWGLAAVTFESVMDTAASNTAADLQRVLDE